MQGRLYRDMQTAMPPGGAEDHDIQSVALADISHEKIADPRVEAWLDEAEAQADTLSNEEKANLRAMRRWWLAQAALPDDLASALKKAENEGERLHTEEKPNGDWQKVLPFFKRQFALVQQAAKVKQEKLGAATPFDAMLDGYAPGWTSEDYDQLFDEIEPYLKKLLPQAMALQQELPPLEGPFPADAEEKLAREVAERMGLDFSRAVLYFIPDHPSGGGTLNDVRISGRPDADNFLAPLYDLIHEAGHGLYDQNVPSSWLFQPAGQAASMEIHEAQSLIWEFVVGKSRAFSVWMAGRAAELFDRKEDPAFTPDNIFRRVSHVTPSLVRIAVETSEITYLLHIIMRYRLEKGLFDGTVQPETLPGAWNDMAEEMFGRRPQNNTEGVMQDVHWFGGSFGYFPSYALGYLGAVQFFAAAVRAHPAIPAEIAKGNFKLLKDWLAENVHSKGSLQTSKELVEQATGAPLGTAAMKQHLENRYLSGTPW